MTTVESDNTKAMSFYNPEKGLFKKNEPPDTIHSANLMMFFLERGIQAEKVPELMASYKKTVIEVSKAKNEIVISDSKEKNKSHLLMASIMFILIPLIPGVNILVASSIASIGAVAFGAAIFDFFKSGALEAGLKLRNFFSNPVNKKN